MSECRVRNVRLLKACSCGSIPEVTRVSVSVEIIFKFIRTTELYGIVTTLHSFQELSDIYIMRENDGKGNCYSVVRG